MSKHAYLILTDLHYAPSKENRINYIGEVIHILEQVIAKRDELNSEGYETFLILLGDVVDAGIRSPEDAMRCQDLFRFLSKMFKKVYVTLGNHETSYITNNPFWFMVSSLEDPSIAAIKKAVQPQSLDACFEVPAIVEDGNVRFFFNHHGTTPKLPDMISGKINIGLFHQNLGSNEICKMWGQFDDVERVAYVQQYDYLFLGHMHLASGTYQLSEDESHKCVGQWLGSCVGTNVTEVEEMSNKPLCVPVVLIDDGVFQSIEQSKLSRVSAREAIDYERIELSKQVMPKVLKEQTSGAISDFTGSLFERVYKAASLENISVIVDVLKRPLDELMREYRMGLMEASDEAVQEFISEEDDG